MARKQNYLKSKNCDFLGVKISKLFLNYKLINLKHWEIWGKKLIKRTYHY